MNTWIEQLADLSDAGTPAVLITVAATRGSTPRAPGAHMIVSADACHGTIGGGQFELRAIGLARQLLADGATGASLVRFPLGASVGQCCGGVMQLVFEPVPAAAPGWIATARALAAAGRPWGRSVALGGGDTHVFDEDAVARVFAEPAQAERARSLLAGSEDSAALAATTPATGADRLIDVSVPPELQVVLFGAGHVGRALAEVFGRLPMRVRWIDPRAEEFPARVAPNIDVRCTDVPEAEVRDAPADAVFLVLTHSHALDFDLVRAILERGDFRLCGLIGSQAKRASFEQRLRARGYGEQAIARLHSPIGVPGLPGKEPEVIAISIAAEVLQLRGTSLAARPARRHEAAA
jgi:xanthine dehydrogenase accessory factor